MLDLTKLLKGHEGEVFYTTSYGYMTFKGILPDCTYCIMFVPMPNIDCTITYFTQDGKLCANSDSERVLFPSKTQRSWKVWAKDNDMQTNNIKNPWISVKDRLPENDGKYLLRAIIKYDNGGSSECFEVGLYDLGLGIFHFGYVGRFLSKEITHWMPIPKFNEE